MNRHWQSFTDDIPWFNERNETVTVGTLTPPGNRRLREGPAAVFPRLAQLLAGAHTSTVSIGTRDFILFSWESDTGIATWLSPRPPLTPPGDIFPTHRSLLADFGGITERSQEPESTWLLNTNESLTADEARNDGTFVREYQWTFGDVPGAIPIDPTAYYSISAEANGNTTLCHRRSGEVLLAAPDHSFDDVEILEGCPPYTLYRRRGGKTFVEWVETVAQQWASAVFLGP